MYVCLETAGMAAALDLLRWGCVETNCWVLVLVLVLHLAYQAWFGQDWNLSVWAAEFGFFDGKPCVCNCVSMYVEPSVHTCVCVCRVWGVWNVSWQIRVTQETGPCLLRRWLLPVFALPPQKRTWQAQRVPFAHEINVHTHAHSPFLQSSPLLLKSDTNLTFKRLTFKDKPFPQNLF